jgi:hypothetical protein
LLHPGGMSRFCLLLVLTVNTAWALPWVVPETQTATELQADLDRLWSAHDMQVTTKVLADGDRLTFENGDLVLYARDHRYEREWDGRTDTAVLLARTWLRSLRVADGGWIPELPQEVTTAVVLQPTAPPPQADKAPLITLPPPRLTAGLGMRIAPVNGYGLDGPRLVAGLRSGPVSVELDVFFAAGSYLRESSIDRKLFSLFTDASFQGYDTYLDVFTVSLMGELGMPPPKTRKWMSGPLLLGGVELRRSVLRTLTSSPIDAQSVVVLDPADVQYDIGPVAGVGLDLWVTPSVRLRASGVDRIRYRRRNQDSARRWIHDYALMADVLILL